LEIIVGSEDYDAEIAERYGWINRAIPDAELDDFVDRFARRIASFEKKALTEAKRLVNRSSLLPDDAHLVAAGETFLRMLHGQKPVHALTRFLSGVSRNLETLSLGLVII
jgi:enoyl-CoA hydratase/carnithine racemase